MYQDLQDWVIKVAVIIPKRHLCWRTRSRLSHVFCSDNFIGEHKDSYSTRTGRYSEDFTSCRSVLDTSRAPLLYSVLITQVLVQGLFTSNFCECTVSQIALPAFLSSFSASNILVKEIQPEYLGDSRDSRSCLH